MSEESLHSSFPDTRWSIVLAVRDGGDSTLGHNALAELCRIYWAPLYGFARSLGNAPEDAEDLTQGFIQHVLKNGLLGAADASAGRLRNYLRKSFTNYIRNHHRTANAKMRGGGCEIVHLDSLHPIELEVQQGTRDDDTPDHLYDRLCALALVEESLARLEAEQQRAGKGALFAAFKPYLDPVNGGHEPQETLVRELGMSLASVRTTLCRLRRRFRELLRLLVRDTLHQASEAEVSEELRCMREVLLR